MRSKTRNGTRPRTWMTPRRRISRYRWLAFLKCNQIKIACCMRLREFWYRTSGIRDEHAIRPLWSRQVLARRCLPPCVRHRLAARWRRSRVRRGRQRLSLLSRARWGRGQAEGRERGDRLGGSGSESGAEGCEGRRRRRSCEGIAKGRRARRGLVRRIRDEEEPLSCLTGRIELYFPSNSVSAEACTGRREGTNF